MKCISEIVLLVASFDGCRELRGSKVTDDRRVRVQSGRGEPHFGIFIGLGFIVVDAGGRDAGRSVQRERHLQSGNGRDEAPLSYFSVYDALHTPKRHDAPPAVAREERTASLAGVGDSS